MTGLAAVVAARSSVEDSPSSPARWALAEAAGGKREGEDGLDPWGDMGAAIISRWLCSSPDGMV